MPPSRQTRSRVAAALLTLSATLGMLAVTDAARAAPQPKLHTIVINKMAYGPAPAGVRAGDVIQWVNKDLFRHTATARDKSFNVDLKPGAVGRTRVTKTGAIDYYCIFHPGMKGRVVAAK